MSSNGHKTTMCNVCGKVKTHACFLKNLPYFTKEEEEEEEEGGTGCTAMKIIKKIFMVKRVSFIQSNLFTKIIFQNRFCFYLQCNHLLAFAISFLHDQDSTHSL